MTDEEKKIIRTMRLEGVGYKAIATALQMSRDTIRAYCKRSGLRWTEYIFRAYCPGTDRRWECL